MYENGYIIFYEFQTCCKSSIGFVPTVLLLEGLEYLEYLFFIVSRVKHSKGRLNGFERFPAVLSTNLWNDCWALLNNSVTLRKVLKKVDSLSNCSRIKFELGQTFARLP